MYEIYFKLGSCNGTSKGSCLSCPTGSFLFVTIDSITKMATSSDCIISCPLGYSNNSFDNTCDVCYEKCQTCF